MYETRTFIILYNVLPHPADRRLYTRIFIHVIQNIILDIIPFLLLSMHVTHGDIKKYLFYKLLCEYAFESL